MGGTFLTLFLLTHLFRSVIMLLSDMAGKAPLYRKYVKDLFFLIFDLQFPKAVLVFLWFF